MHAAPGAPDLQVKNNRQVLTLRASAESAGILIDTIDSLREGVTLAQAMTAGSTEQQQAGAPEHEASRTR